jgi:hypothetical protein
MGQKLPLDVCSPSFESTKETSYGKLGYKKYVKNTRHIYAKQIKIDAFNHLR